MPRVLRDPLLQFLLLGAALFVIFRFTRGNGSDESSQILVKQGQIHSLAAAFERTWQRQPTPEELDGLIEDHVREEIAVREAIALGLDRDDAIIRRRLRMKLDLVSEELASQTDPTDAELLAFMQQHADSYRIDPAVAFLQVYFNPDKRRDAAAEAKVTLSRLRKESWTEPHALGDPSLLPQQVALTSQSDVSRQFGEEFTAAILQLEPGQWSEPVRSSFGWHLVFVSETRPGRMPELSEVRDAVERDWFAVRRKEMQEEFYRQLRKRYDVVIEPSQEAGKAGTQAAMGSP